MSGQLAEREVRLILELNVFQSATERDPVVVIPARARESCCQERERPLDIPRVTGAWDCPWSTATCPERVAMFPVAVLRVLLIVTSCPVMVATFVLSVLIWPVAVARLIVRDEMFPVAVARLELVVSRFVVRFAMFPVAVAMLEFNVEIVPERAL